MLLPVVAAQKNIKTQFTFKLLIVIQQTLHENIYILQYLLSVTDSIIDL